MVSNLKYWDYADFAEATFQLPNLACVVLVELLNLDE